MIPVSILTINLSPLFFLLMINLISGKVSEHEELKTILMLTTYQWWQTARKNYRKHDKNGLKSSENVASE